MRKNLFVAVFVLMGTLISSNASAQLVLPDPNLELAPGEFIATQHDHFYAYSALLNHVVFPDQGWNFSTGTGGLDLLLYTGARGVNNLGVGAGGAFNFENPMIAPSGGTSTFFGTWGVGNQSNGPVTVDNLYSYLTTTFGANASIPVFYFDQNQSQGGGEDLYIAGKVSIWDPLSSTEVAFWAFDGIDNGIFDVPNLSDLLDPAWVLAEGTLEIPGYPSLNHNAGSGKADYIAIAPTMDLSLYLGHNYLFRADFYMAGLTNGPEELFLTGAIARPVCPNGDCGSVIPEPGTMVLVGSGLIGAVGLRRRKRS